MITGEGTISIFKQSTEKSMENLAVLVSKLPRFLPFQSTYYVWEVKTAIVKTLKMIHSRQKHVLNNQFRHLNYPKSVSIKPLFIVTFGLAGIS
jgi:hypothetical protein